jgi:hypothetical protein
VFQNDLVRGIKDDEISIGLPDHSFSADR